MYGHAHSFDTKLLWTCREDFGSSSDCKYTVEKRQTSSISLSSNGDAERILAPAAVVIASPGIACNVILSVHLGWQNLEWKFLSKEEINTYYRKDEKVFFSALIPFYRLRLACLYQSLSCGCWWPSWRLCWSLSCGYILKGQYLLTNPFMCSPL